MPNPPIHIQDIVSSNATPLSTSATLAAMAMRADIDPHAASADMHRLARLVVIVHFCDDCDEILSVFDENMESIWPGHGGIATAAIAGAALHAALSMHTAKLIVDIDEIDSIAGAMRGYSEADCAARKIPGIKDPRS